MRLPTQLGSIAAIVLLLAAPSTAQTREGLMGDLIKDISEVESKVVGLAKAMPEGTYAWRPSPGVRSTGEVFAHVAADNYFLPAAMGIAAPTETGINGKDFKTAAAFEKRSMTRDQVVAELTKSFAFLKTSMNGVTDAQLNAPIELFGQKSTHRSMWVTTATHLHEHLGQLIAYARSNKVTPPWSK
jgi:hypothetical protein